MNKNAVIALVLLVALVGAFFVNQRITANVVVSSPQAKCIDSDATAANQFEIASEARLGTTVRRDSCGIWPFSSTVHEATCDFSKNEEGRIVITSTRCDSECLDGRCVPYGGSITLIAKDAQTFEPITKAEAILYSSSLDEVTRKSADNDRKITIPNERVTFPPSIKKLFREHDIDEPVVFELHTNQYDVSVQALEYTTQVKSVTFEEGKDARVEVLLEKETSISQNVLTGRIADEKEQQIQQGSSKILRVPNTLDVLDAFPSKQTKNPDGSITFDYSENGDDFKDIKHTRFVNERKSTTDVITSEGDSETFIRSPDGSFTVSKIKKGQFVPEESYTQTPSQDGGFTMKYENAIDLTFGAEGTVQKRVSRANNERVETDEFNAGNLRDEHIETVVHEDGSKTVRTFLETDEGATYGVAKIEEYDSGGAKKLTRYHDFKDDKKLSEEEYLQEMERLREEKDKKLVEKEIPTVFGKSKLEESEQEQPLDTSSSATSFSKKVNLVLLPQTTSTGCKYLIADVAMTPSDKVKYSETFYVSGNIKKTAGCTGIFEVALTTLGTTRDALAHDKQGGFRLGPFASTDLDGDTKCVLVEAWEVHGTGAAASSGRAAGEQGARAAFAYTADGCSNPDLCPYGTNEQGTTISYCKRYHHTEPCRAGRTSYRSCLDVVKF